ncbi:MAG: hypothetical protein QXI39_02150 [Candidatus Bathyarchaeia archaeon]
MEVRLGIVAPREYMMHLIVHRNRKSGWIVSGGLQCRGSARGGY